LSLVGFLFYRSSPAAAIALACHDGKTNARGAEQAK